MTSVWVESVVFGRLFTFSPHTRVSQLRPIDDRPVSVASPVNYPAYLCQHSTLLVSMILIYEKSSCLFVFKLQSKNAYIIKVKLQKVLDENLENKTLIAYLRTITVLAKDLRLQMDGIAVNGPGLFLKITF